MVLVVPDCFLVAVKAVSNGQDVVNVVGVHGPGNNAFQVATAVRDAWKTAGGPLSKQSTSYQLVEFRAMSINSANGEIYSLPDAATGPLTSVLATNGSCALITYGSGTRAKSTKGRMYFGPLREGDVNSDGRTLANAAAFTTAFGVFQTNLTQFGRNWVVISRKNSTHSPITQVQTQTVIATQRRRIR